MKSVASLGISHVLKRRVTIFVCSQELSKLRDRAEHDAVTNEDECAALRTKLDEKCKRLAELSTVVEK